VKDRARLGDLARIDTVEAELEVQKRTKRLLNARLQLRQARQALSNFWIPEAEVSPNEAKPDSLIEPGAFPGIPANRIDTFVQNHPEILKLSAKQRQLQLEERYRWGQVLPDIRLDYNVLRSAPSPAGTNNGEAVNTAYFQNNYKAGARVSVPLLLRKDRAKLEEVQLKQRMIQMDQSQVNRSVRTGIENQRAAVDLLRQQVQNQREAVASARKLLEGEREKFQAGASTLFLVNRRERSWLAARREYIRLLGKLQKAQAKLLETSGQSPAQLVE
jgi:outer membrane protein TolC